MIFRNSFLSLLSLALPLLVGLVTVPMIIADLGLERFGVLTLVWAVMGYASLFDLGISRALTRRVAELHGQPLRLASVVRSGLGLLGLFGLTMGVLTGWLASLFDYQRFALQPQEFNRSLVLMAISVVWVIVGGGLRGVLEGVQRFTLVSVVRLGFGLVMFLAPVLIPHGTPTLDQIIGIMLMARIIGCVAMAWACKAFFAASSRGGVSLARRRVEIRHLFSFGGWITVSNLVSAVLLYADRFLLAYSPFALSLALYTTPYEFVTRLFIVPAALSGVLFPYLARGRSFSQASRQLPGIASAMTLALVTPVVAALVLFAPQILTRWIDATFAASAALPLKILAVGVLLNCLGQIYQTAILARGKALWIARLHIVEMLIFVPCLYLMLQSFGIEGVAWAWTLRVVIDAVALLAMLGRLVDAPRYCGRALLTGLLVAGLVFASSGLDMPVKALLLAGLSAVCAIVVVWLFRHAAQREF